MTTKDFSWEELGILIDLVPVSTRPWKWGHTDTFVFEEEGVYWQVEVDVHSSDGWQMYGSTVTATKVVPRQKTITEWVPADD